MKITPAFSLLLLLLLSFSFEYHSKDTHLFINSSLVGIFFIVFLIYKFIKKIKSHEEYKISIQQLFQHKVISEYEKIIPSIFIIFLLGNFSTSQEATTDINYIFYQLSWGRDYLSIAVLLLSIFAIFLQRVLQLIKTEQKGHF